MDINRYLTLTTFNGGKVTGYNYLTLTIFNRVKQVDINKKLTLTMSTQ